MEPNRARSARSGRSIGGTWARLRKHWTPGGPKGPTGVPKGAPWRHQGGPMVLSCRRNARFFEKWAFRLHQSTSWLAWGPLGPLGATFGVPWAALGRPSGCLGAFFVDLFASRTIHNTSVDKFGGGIAPNLIQDWFRIRSQTISPHNCIPRTGGLPGRDCRCCLLFSCC